MSVNLTYFYKKFFASKIYLIGINKQFIIKCNSLPIINKPMQKSISTQTSFEDLSIIQLEDSEDVDGVIPSQSYIDAGIYLHNLSQ